MGGEKLDLAEFIRRHEILSKSDQHAKTVPYSEWELRSLIDLGRESLMGSGTLVEPKVPITFVGDIHGQYADMLRIFQSNGLPPVRRYIFLGDYVDRGKRGLECIVLLTALKVAYPKSFFILRGNHECQHINELYGFFDECSRRFNVSLWKAFNEMFKCLPLAGLVAGQILCMHGGLSPDLHSLDDIRNIKRPTVVMEPGLKSDLLWADPEFGLVGWERSQRGIGHVFGTDVVRKTCKELNLTMIVRAHQVVQDGYQFFAKRKLVTIFSAANYCNEFNNRAAVLNLDTQLRCTIQTYAEGDKHFR